MSDASSDTSGPPPTPSEQAFVEESSSNVGASKSPPSLWLSYLRLLRLPNVFTALADVLLGAFLVQDGAFPWLTCTLLLCASACLYSAGMVLNDVYDVEIDRVERPERPLPSGRISLIQAARIGWLLLAAGMAFAGSASFAIEDNRPILTALFLTTAIVLYDGWLKHTLLGPIAMGTCRALNVTLGLCATRMDWRTDQIVVAVGLGVYIAGVTSFAKREAERSRPGDLTFGTAVMMLGVAIAASHTFWRPADNGGLHPPIPMWHLLMGFLALMVARRCVAAIWNPEPIMVQAAVKHALLTYVMLDAALALPAQGAYAAAVILVLLLPTAVLGRWVYQT